MFQRVGAPAYKRGLKNISLLYRALDALHYKMPTVHVRETSGKGSSAHLKWFTERIKINEVEVSDEFVEATLATVRDYINIPILLKYYPLKKGTGIQFDPQFSLLVGAEVNFQAGLFFTNFCKEIVFSKRYVHLRLRDTSGPVRLTICFPHTILNSTILKECYEEDCFCCFGLFYRVA